MDKVIHIQNIITALNFKCTTFNYKMKPKKKYYKNKSFLKL